MITRHVIASPTGAAGPPSLLTDLETEGADLLLGFSQGDLSLYFLYDAKGAAQLAELILRTLHRLGHTPEAREATQQAWLEISGGDKAAVLQVPRNTIRGAKLL